jgi:hypothetical protein
MAINPNLLSGVRVTAPTPTTKRAVKAPVNPIADRNFLDIPFIRDAAPECENPMDAILAAWEDSPQETILALLSYGMEKPDIARLIGLDLRSDDDKKTWVKVLNGTKTYAQMCISEALLVEKDAAGEWVSVIPDDYTQTYLDKDKNECVAECAERVRKALHKALWRPDYRVVCSIARGVPFANRANKDGKPIHFQMWEVITWTRDRIEHIYHQADEQLARMMKTAQKLQYLTPGMMKHLKAKAANAAAMSAEQDDDEE